MFNACAVIYFCSTIIFNMFVIVYRASMNKDGIYNVSHNILTVLVLESTYHDHVLRPLARVTTHRCNSGWSALLQIAWSSQYN